MYDNSQAPIEPTQMTSCFLPEHDYPRVPEYEKYHFIGVT